MPATTVLSYAAGPTDVPLLEEMIGATLRRISAEHASAKALVDLASGGRWTSACPRGLPELKARVDRSTLLLARR